MPLQTRAPCVATAAGWAGELRTRDGATLIVRPVGHGDEAILRRLFDRVTPADLRFRFLSSMRHVDHARIAAMINVVPDRSNTFIAFDEMNSPVATAMLVGDDDMAEAEVAVTVRSDRKGRGIGWALLQHVLRYAKASGFRRVRSIEKRANTATLALEHDAGFSFTPCEGDSTMVTATFDLNAVRH